MSKRIIRIFSDTIVQNISQLNGSHVVIILKNGQTFKGEFVKLDLNDVYLKVNSNKILQFSIDSIIEIQIDKISSW
jgi:hypothetical protein